MLKSLNLKKTFFLYLFCHLFLWSVITLLRDVLPIDAAEGIYWGSLSDFGTNKHPPLAGWISYFVYNISGDFFIYLLGQIFIVTGLFYTYKIGKLFLEETPAILSAMIMEACYVYSYCTIYDGFNPNFLLFCFLPMIVYYFYLAINKNNISHWISLGILAGLSSLAKYQSLMLFIPMFLFLIFTKQGRMQFKKSGLYIAALIAFLIFLPHLIWLFQNDFFSFGYFLASEKKYSLFYNSNLKYIFAPALFLLRQLIALSGVFFIYLTAKLFCKSKTEMIPFKEHLKNPNSVFLIYMGILPIIIQTLPGFINGAFMIPVWGYTLLFPTGILLFYFFPVKCTDKYIKYVVSWIFATMVIIATILAIIFSTFRDFSSLYPTKEIHDNLKSIYRTETNHELKYIGGFIEYSIPISLYDKNIITVLDCWGHKNPWQNESDIMKNGIIILERDPANIIPTIKSILPKVNDKNINIGIMNVKIHSLTGKEKICNLYYAIVKPLNYE